MLNWEKCHFMVQEGIVLGHHVSSKGIVVDRGKIETIEKLPPLFLQKVFKVFLAMLGFIERKRDSSEVLRDSCSPRFYHIGDLI